MITSENALINSIPGQRVYIGDSLEEFKTILETYPEGSVVVFTGRSSADQSGAWEELEQAIGSVQRKAVRFSGIEAEPDTETVERMVSFLKEVNPAVVIALGGGSVMDVAKAAYLVLQSGWNISDHFGTDCYSKTIPQDTKLKKVICIPTTAGTGSEATPYANIVDHRLKVKKLIAEQLIVPEVAFLVPRFTATMPTSVALASGCDALAHLIEGYLNIGMGEQDELSELARACALTGIRKLVGNLPYVIQHSESGYSHIVRRNMSIAAYLGGVVIRFKPTGIPHLCSFTLYGRVPHGIAVSLLLPVAWRFYLEDKEVQDRTMGLQAWFDGADPGEIVDAYRRFLDILKVPQSLQEFPEVSAELLAETARSGSQNPMKLSRAPRPVPIEQAEGVLRNILNEAFYGNNRRN